MNWTNGFTRHLLAVIFLTTGFQLLVCASELDERYSFQANNNGFDPEPHHIVKRAVTSPPNVTIELVKTGENENITSMYTGTKICFELTIQFPVGTTDMLVELFTPDNETTVMMLCDVVVKPFGSALTSDMATIEPKLQSKDGTMFMDWAVIDCGNVTNSGAGAVEADIELHITWCAVMIDIDNSLNGSTYWVSAGAEYNQENEIYVAQSSFTATTDDPKSVGTLTFNLTGPDEMPVGTAGLFTSEFYMGYSVADLSFDAFAPLNTTSVMTVCAARVKDVGPYYECSLDPTKIKDVLTAAQSGLGNSRVNLDIGKIVNAGCRSAAYDKSLEKITLEFVSQFYNDEALVGQSFDIGCAMEIDTDQIWAGNLNVAVTSNNATLNPTVTYNYPNTQTVPAGDPFVMEVIIEIPPGFASPNFDFEMLAPYNFSLPVFRMCAVKIESIGGNMPCGDTTAEATYYDLEGTTTPYRAVLSLGGITNVGWKTTADDPDINKIKILAVLASENHTLAVDTSEHTITSGLTFGPKLWIGTNTVTIGGVSQLESAINNDTSPTFSLDFAIGDENVPVGGQVAIKMDLTTKRNVSFDKFDVEFIMPHANNTPFFSICKAEIKSVGKNIPCLVKSVENRKITNTSRYIDGVYDMSAFVFDSLCNIEIKDNTTEDVVEFIAYLKVMDHVGLPNNDLWASIGSSYTGNYMWIGQIKIVPQTNPSFSVLVTDPYIVMTKNSTYDKTPSNYPMKYTILIKLAPNETLDFEVNATATDPQLSICGLRIAAVGSSLPCVNESMVAAYTNKASSTVYNDKASLNLGAVGNLGTTTFVANGDFDDNSILIELTLKLHTATLDTEYPFQVKVFYGGTSKVLDDKVVGAADDSAIEKNVTASPSFSTKVCEISGNDTDSDVYNGQSKCSQLDIVLPEGSVFDLKVSFLSVYNNLGNVEFCNAGIVFLGDNVKNCFDQTLLTENMLERTANSGLNDIVEVQIGPVCNAPIIPGNDEANTIRLNAISRFKNKNPAWVEDDSLYTFVAVNVNGVEIQVGQMNWTMKTGNFTDLVKEGLSIENDTLISLNSPAAPLLTKIHETNTFSWNLTIPQGSCSTVQIDAVVPVVESACMTIMDVRYIKSGDNLGCILRNDAPLNIVYRSSNSSSQMDKMLFDLGIVCNSAFTVQKGTYTAEDDQLQIEIVLETADCIGNENGTSFFQSIGLKAADRIVIYDSEVRIDRTNNEKVLLWTNGSIISETGSSSFLTFTVKQDDNSTAEAFNATCTITAPSCMLISSAAWNTTVTEQTTLPSSEPYVVDLESIFFTDIFHVNFTVAPNNTAPCASEIDPNELFVIFECFYNMHERANNPESANVSASEIASVAITLSVGGVDTVLGKGLSRTKPGNKLPVIFKMRFTEGKSDAPTLHWQGSSIRFTFCEPLTKCRGQSKTEASCNSVLGMDSHVIPDGHIKGRSGSGNMYSDPNKARSNDADKFQPGSPGGPNLKSARCLDVYFDNCTKVTAIDVAADGPCVPSQLDVRFSKDAKSWIPDAENLINLPSLWTNPEKVFVNNPPLANVIRICVSNDNCTTGTDRKDMHFGYELYGCGTNAPCDGISVPTDPTPLVADMCRRHFIGYSGKVYLCDSDSAGNDQEKPLRQKCFMSADGITWTKLKETLAYIVGVDTDTGNFYGLTENQQTAMVSVDAGTTWASCDPSYVAAAKLALPTFKRTICCPWTVNATFSTADPTASFQSDIYGANSEGIYLDDSGTWKQIVNWNSCC